MDGLPSGKRRGHGFYPESTTTGRSSTSGIRSTSRSSDTSGESFRSPRVIQPTPRTSTGYQTSGAGHKSKSTTATPRSSKTCVESLDPNSVLAIVEGRGQARGEIGIACINLQSSTLIVCQFTDTQTYNKVVAKINIFRPSEILMTMTACEGTGVASQLYLQLKKEVSNIRIVPMPRRIFSDSKGLEIIKRVVVNLFSPVIHVITQKYYCLAAASALLRFVETDYSISFPTRTMKVEFQGSEMTCMIDSTTAQHLELLQNNHHPVSAVSLLGILSNCRTPGGSRLLRMNILQPPCDLTIIQLRLDCVEELIESRDTLHGLQDILGRLPVDIEHVIATLIQIQKEDNDRLKEQRINSIIALKHTLELLPAFVSVLEATRHDYLQRFREDFESSVFESMLEKIQHVIHDEAQVQKGSANMKRQRCFAVKADVNPILDIARKAYCEIINDMNEYVVDLSNKLSMPFKLKQNNKRGFYVELVLRGNVDCMPTLPSHFLQVRQKRNVVTFTTEILLSSDHRSQEISKEIDNISAIVISELISSIRCKIGYLYKISEAVANLDVLYALANYSLTTLRCVRPRFSNQLTSITMGRHPVLESVGSIAPPVPNNTFLSIDANFAIITGPNMSGKTTYLKQIATLQILAQLGSFVPAEAATFRIVSNIFSRIGTGDNIEGSASSFALEMTEMNYILSNVNENSLIIIDELGRATSIEEGTAMSWVLAEALLNTKSFVLFATHYLFLTKLESFHENVLNYTLETQEWGRVPKEEEDETSSDTQIPTFSCCKLKYTHELKRGVTEVKYYGLKLANSSSIPPNIVSRAATIAEHITGTNKNKDASAKTSTEEPSNHANYLLASQLHIASQLSDSIDKDIIRHYLDSLKQEYCTKCLISEEQPVSPMDTQQQQNDEAGNQSLLEVTSESCSQVQIAEGSETGDHESESGVHEQSESGIHEQTASDELTNPESCTSESFPWLDVTFDSHLQNHDLGMEQSGQRDDELEGQWFFAHVSKRARKGLVRNDWHSPLEGAPKI